MPRAFLIKKPSSEDGGSIRNEYLPDFTQIGINGGRFLVPQRPVSFNVGVRFNAEINKPTRLRNPFLGLPGPGQSGVDLEPFLYNKVPDNNIKKEPVDFSELYDIFAMKDSFVQTPSESAQMYYDKDNTGGLKAEPSSMMVREVPWAPINVLFSMESRRTRDETNNFAHVPPKQQQLLHSGCELVLPEAEVKKETTYDNVGSKDLPPLVNCHPRTRNNSVFSNSIEDLTYGRLGQYVTREEIHQWQGEIQDVGPTTVRVSPPETVIVISDDELFDEKEAGVVPVTSGIECYPSASNMRVEANSNPQEDHDEWSFPSSPSFSPHGHHYVAQPSEGVEDITEYDSVPYIGVETEKDVINDMDKEREAQDVLETSNEDHQVEQRGHAASDLTPKKNYRYTCDVCGRSFSRSNTLTTHKRIHTGDKPFKCETCGRAFRQPGNLTRHRLTHTTAKPYVCPQCNKAFNRASNLHTHMRTHTNIKPFVCDFCGKGFHQKIDMKIHRYTHTGEKPHKCAKCGRGFKQLTHLTYHMRTHSESRMYHCQFCGKGFNQKGNLQAHIYGHTGERPFKCDVCGKGFTLASTLNTHKRTHAPMKPFECQFCKKSFYQKNALKTHYLASHPYTGGKSLL